MKAIAKEEDDSKVSEANIADRQDNIIRRNQLRDYLFPHPIYKSGSYDCQPTNEARAEAKLVWTMPCKEEEGCE